MKRIPWNIYEATLMLDTYFRIESGEIASKSAIAELSSTLRLMAVNNGDIIDNIYRNENGIAIQLGCMKYVLTNGKYGFSHGPKIYSEIVRIYKQEPEKYAQILKEAKRMIKG